MVLLVKNRNALSSQITNTVSTTISFTYQETN